MADDGWGDDVGSSTAAAGGRSGNKGCFKCGEEGHMSRECPSGGGDSGPKTCRKCNEEGHIGRDCPNNPSGGGGGDNKCRNCKQVSSFNLCLITQNYALLLIFSCNIFLICFDIHLNLNLILICC